MARALALDHFVLVVADVERTMAWYMDHLGLAPDRLDEWRAGEVFFPSLRVDEATIIDVIPGELGEGRGHLDHVCFVVSEPDLATLTDDPALEIVDQGERYGARGIGQSIYVHDPDGLMVEIRSYPA